MRSVLILICLVAVLIGVVQWRAGVRERAAVASHPPIGQLLDVDGVSVHAWVAGDGPDLVLIHGASGNLRDFTLSLTDQLTDRYRVIVFDRPGLGYTDRLPGTAGAWNAASESPQAQAAVLQKAADQLGVQNPIVLGHSYGGAVALAWGLSRPDDTAALALIAAVSQPWPGGLGWLYQVTGSAWGGALAIPVITAFLPQSYVEGSIDAIFAPQPAPDAYGDYIGTGLTLRRFSTRANGQQVNSLRPHIVDMAAQYDRLTMPIELVHGDADTIVPAHIHAQVFAANVASANLTLLEGIGHMPQHVDPASTIAAIDRAAARAGLR